MTVGEQLLFVYVRDEFYFYTLIKPVHYFFTDQRTFFLRNLCRKNVALVTVVQM